MYLVLQSYKINTYICTHNKTFYKAYTKMYKSRQIADWIIHQTHGNITHSKLQKLLYYCQAWHYTIFNEVLFDERIEAWRTALLYHPNSTDLIHRFFPKHKSKRL